MYLEWGGFARFLEVIQGEGKGVHVIMDGLEVKATCCRLKGRVDDVRVLLAYNSQPGKPFLTLGGADVIAGEV
jgi:hypothetical protein